MTVVKRIPSLDGLRAISIGMVIVAHLAEARDSHALWGAYGKTGVRIFFVISGYLITTILLKEHQRTSTIDLREFYFRRAYRIFPAAIVFMLVGVAVCWREIRWYNVATAFLYLSNYDPTRPWMFGHLWSLSVEEQFYFLWPGVLRLWRRYQVGILLGVIALSPICHVVLYYFKVPGGGSVFFPVVANYLAIGCLLAVFAPKIPKFSGYLALGMVLVVMLSPFFPSTTRGRTLVALFAVEPLVLLSIAGIVLHVVRAPYRVLNWAPVVWLGNISYSLYLWQEPFCPNPRFRPAVAVLLSILAACLSYYLIEVPMLMVRGRRLRGHDSREATATAVKTIETAPATH
jgi:peptidoglycan/LPS O-acetylase OafA/YrhL